MNKLFGCPYVFESENCAVIWMRDEGYVFGQFRSPRRAFESIATFAQTDCAKRAFDAYNRAISGSRMAASPRLRCSTQARGDSAGEDLHRLTRLRWAAPFHRGAP